MAKIRRDGDATRKGPAEAELVVALRRIVHAAKADKPLPSTRELGTRFGVANATVFRVLQRLADGGELWHHPVSGRYYPSSARALLEQPKPTACLIRRLEVDSEQYREILEGISSGCGELHRTMMLWHDVHLVNHLDLREPPVFASVPHQKEILRHFLQRHGKAAGGFIFDHLWSDEALGAHEARLQPAVVLYRSSKLSSFSNIRSDFHSGASKALTHLLGRGFEQIIPVEPFTGDPAVTEFFDSLDRVAKEAGCADRIAGTMSASNAAQRAKLIEHAKGTQKRIALLCPEDNVTTLLFDALKNANISIPQRVGLLSVMGTDFAVRANVTCLRYDFRAMGRLAAQTMGSRTPVTHVFEPELRLGATS